jgi:hypothetical protein
MSVNSEISNDVYYKKYLKYKTKYLELKKQTGGDLQLLFVKIKEGDRWDIFEINGREIPNSEINKLLSAAPLSATSITKEQLLEYLQKIKKCYLTNEIDPGTPLTGLCDAIYKSSNLIIGIRDSSNESYGFMDLGFNKTGEGSLMIYWAVSDGGGKGRYLLSVAEQIARSMGLKRLKLAATPTSAPFWTHMGFSTKGDNIYTKNV